MTFAMAASLLFLGIATVLWWLFLNKTKELLKGTKASIKLNTVAEEILVQLIPVDKSFKAFGESSTKSVTKYIDYYMAFLNMMDNLMRRHGFSKSDTTTLTGKYMKPLTDTFGRMVEYIAYEKQYNEQFDEALQACKSIVDQVEAYMTNTNVHHSARGLMFNLQKLDLCATIALMSFLLSQVFVEKVNNPQAKDNDNVISETHELLLDRIHTLAHEILETGINNLAGVHFRKGQQQQSGKPQKSGEILDMDITVTINGKECLLAYFLTQTADYLCNRKLAKEFGPGLECEDASSAISNTHLSDWEIIIPELKSPNEIIDFIQRFNNQIKSTIQRSSTNYYSCDEGDGEDDD
ncbi:hypothetical protein H4219_005333 [Mycoemilia scoparia]|uniref:Uncharacterized protein n=1 Tax=Mycoemilia scoparia TaxID=417184 RepID=A0A9W7ZTF3_9FUNG|nr:hypothetical protein H4219_005333 [Mycoemilia scoparia]